MTFTFSRTFEICFCLYLIGYGSCSLLLVDRKNPCRAYGNATVFDITKLVDKWPITLTGPGADGREYYYWWSCLGKTDQCSDPDVAVCQRRTDQSDLFFNAGNLSPQLWFGQFNGASVEV